MRLAAVRCASRWGASIIRRSGSPARSASPAKMRLSTARRFHRTGAVVQGLCGPHSAGASRQHRPLRDEMRNVADHPLVIHLRRPVRKREVGRDLPNLRPREPEQVSHGSTSGRHGSSHPDQALILINGSEPGCPDDDHDAPRVNEGVQARGDRPAAPSILDPNCGQGRHAGSATSTPDVPVAFNDLGLNWSFGNNLSVSHGLQINVPKQASSFRTAKHRCRKTFHKNLWWLTNQC